MRKNRSTRSRAIRAADIAVVCACLLGTAAFLFLFQRDLNRSLRRLDQEPAGFVSFRSGAALRRFQDRNIWERLQREAPVYNGDLIRTAGRSEVAIGFSGGALVDVSENSLIRVSLEEGAPRIDFSRGTISVQAGESGNVNISFGKNRVQAAAGSTINIDIKARADAAADANIAVDAGTITDASAAADAITDTNAIADANAIAGANAIADANANADANTITGVNTDAADTSTVAVANTAAANAGTSISAGEEMTYHIQVLEGNASLISPDGEREAAAGTVFTVKETKPPEEPRRAAAKKPPVQTVQVEVVRVEAARPVEPPPETPPEPPPVSEALLAAAPVETPPPVQPPPVPVGPPPPPPVQPPSAAAPVRPPPPAPAPVKTAPPPVRPPPPVRQPAAPAPAAAPPPRRPSPLPAPSGREPENGYRLDPGTLRESRTIVFRWNPVDGADGYIFTLFHETGPRQRRQVLTLEGPETSYTLEDLSILDLGRFVWQVEAVNRGGGGRRGSPGENLFTVDIPQPEIPRGRNPGDLYAR
jgi:hypothetical protein